MADTSLKAMALRRIRQVQDRYPGVMFDRIRHRDLAAHVLALAAQQVLCTGPLVVAASAVMNAYDKGTVIDLLTNVFGLDKEGAAALTTLFRPHGQPGLQILVLYALTSLGFALSVASTTQRMLETMWDVERAPFRTAWRQVVWLTALVPGLGAAMYATRIMRHFTAPDLVTALLIAAAVGVLSTPFAWWSQRLLLLGQIEWRRLLPGALLIGIGVGLVSAVSVLVVPGQLVDQWNAYGPVGVAFVLAAWIVALTGAVGTGVLAGAVLDERRSQTNERRTALRGQRVRLRMAGRRTRSEGTPGTTPKPVRQKRIRHP